MQYLNLSPTPDLLTETVCIVSRPPVTGMHG